jgi:hypothetical protein
MGDTQERDLMTMRITRPAPRKRRPANSNHSGVGSHSLLRKGREEFGEGNAQGNREPHDPEDAYIALAALDAKGTCPLPIAFCASSASRSLRLISGPT